MDNKRENKLLHYVTRAAFDKDLADGLIANTSIAFIDEGRTIYTWGKEYNTSQVSQEVNQVSEEVERIEREWEDELNAKVEELNALVLLKHADAVARAREDILNARASIQEVSNALSTLAESCSTKTEVQLLLGQINAITNWYNTLEQSLTTLTQQLNAVEGKIVTEGTYTNIVNDAITEYNKEVDLKIAAVREEITHTDEDDLTDSVIGRLMDAENGILKDYATYVQFMNGFDEAVSSLVETTLNSKTPSWDTLVSRVTTVEGQTEALESLYTSLSATVNGFSAITAQVNSNTSRIAQLETHVDDDESKVTLAAVYKVINEEDVNKTIAAKIFAQANASGSNITLSADKINLSGDTTVLGNFVANKIAAADITAKALHVSDTATGNAIDIDATNGIKFSKTIGGQTRNPLLLRMNGSGLLGFHAVTSEVNGETVTTYQPAITWDQNGELTINSAIIGGSGEGGSTTTLIENDYDDAWIRNWKSSYDTWQGNMNTWVSELRSNNTARAYLQAAGIIFDNSGVIDPSTGSGNIVAMTSTSTQGGTVPAGVSHTAVGGDLNGKHGYYLKNDGTGELAFGNIKWDTDGNLIVKNLTVEGTSFASEEGHKVFNIDKINTSYDGVYIDYSIYSSGVLLKRDRLQLYTKELLSNIYDFGGDKVVGIDSATIGNPYFGYITYRSTGSSLDGTNNSSGSQGAESFISLYKWDPIIERATYDDGNLRQYAAKIRFSRCITAVRIMSFLAERSFEYPVFDTNYNVISHTNKMPDGKCSSTSNPNDTIGIEPGDSRDPNGTYWTYEETDPSKLNSEPIEIDPRYRNFVDVHWKEIFSVPDENTALYPDGRKWLIEDGEKIEVTCTDHYMYGPWRTAKSNGYLTSYNNSFNMFNTELERENYINENVVDNVWFIETGGGTSSMQDAPASYTIPFIGSGHVIFKRNPYEFYLNSGTTPVFLHPNDESAYTTWDYRTFRAWGIGIDESRFGWETW